MMRRLRLVLCGCLVASLCSFFRPFCEPALCESGKDWVKDWVTTEKRAFQAAREQEAMNYYSKAVEDNHKLVEKQEEWVRERLRSGKTADLLQRIDVNLRDDESLTIRKDLIEKYDEKLMIRASFLERLIADEFNDAKVYRKGITIKNAIIIGDIDLSNTTISPPVTISGCIFLGKTDLSHGCFQRGMNLEESHFLGPVIASNLKIDRDASFSGAVFLGPVNFFSANIGSNFEARETRFESGKEGANFDSLKVGDAADFRGALFRRHVSFRRANIGSDFYANETRFENTEGTDSFDSLKVGDAAYFVGALFRGHVSFRRANIGSDFYAGKTRFESREGGAIFDSLKVGDTAHFRGALFRGAVSFGWANIASNFDANETRFEDTNGTAVFYYLKVGKDIIFDKSVFRGPVGFFSANIGSSFYADQARFENTEKGAFFESLKVSDDASFRKALFRGPVSFGGVNITSHFRADEVRFEDKDSEAAFNYLKVGKSAVFEKAVFWGPVSFGGVNITSQFQADEVRFEGKKSKASFSGMQVGDVAFFSRAYFRTNADFSRANMRGLRLTDAKFAGTVGFGEATIGDLHVERMKFRKGGEIVLEGMTYNNIYTEAGDHREALDILSHMKRYQPQPYKQLELCYVGAGNKEGADEVFVEGKRREREDTWRWLSWDLPTNVLKFIFLEMGVGYGRYLTRVVWFIIGFISFGTFVFSRPRMFKYERKLSVPSAFWYSLGLFLPFVTLGAEKFHEIQKEKYLSVENLVAGWLANLLPARLKTWPRIRLESYYYVHQLSGYILLSIGIAAIAGIIK